MSSPTPLKPGDCLLYRPTGFLGWAIATKTWMRWSHVEIAVKPGMSIGARPEGVNYYTTRWSRLGAVMRPTQPVDVAKAMAWFDAKAKGQHYDVLGLFRFFTWGKQSTDKQFCSEMATRWYRAGGLEPFHGLDADLIPPGWFYTLADGFDRIWSDETL
jgi:hypothetical protein